MSRKMSVQVAKDEMKKRYITWPEFKFPPINLWSVWSWSKYEKLEKDKL